MTKNRRQKRWTNIQKTKAVKQAVKPTVKQIKQPTTAKQKSQAFGAKLKEKALFNKTFKKAVRIQKGINEFKTSVKEQGVKVKSIKGAGKGYELNSLIAKIKKGEKVSMKVLESTIKKTITSVEPILKPTEVNKLLQGQSVASMMSEEEMAQRYAYDAWVEQQMDQINEYDKDYASQFSDAAEIKEAIQAGIRSWDWYAAKQAKEAKAREYGA